MKPASAKAKGRKLQQTVVKAILDKFPELEPDDCTSRSMGANGEDILLSPAARRKFKYSIECKSVAAFIGYTYLGQAESNTPKGITPIAVVKANNKEPVVIIKLKDFMEKIV